MNNVKYKQVKECEKIERVREFLGGGGGGGRGGESE